MAENVTCTVSQMSDSFVKNYRTYKRNPVDIRKNHGILKNPRKFQKMPHNFRNLRKIL